MRRRSDLPRAVRALPLAGILILDSQYAIALTEDIPTLPRVEVTATGSYEPLGLGESVGPIGGGRGGSGGDARGGGSGGDQIALDLPSARDVRCAATGDLRNITSKHDATTRALAATSVYRNTQIFSRPKLLTLEGALGKVLKVTYADGGTELYKPINPLDSADVLMTPILNSLKPGSGNVERGSCKVVG